MSSSLASVRRTPDNGTGSRCCQANAAPGVPGVAKRRRHYVGFSRVRPSNRPQTSMRVLTAASSALRANLTSVPLLMAVSACEPIRMLQARPETSPVAPALALITVPRSPPTRCVSIFYSLHRPPAFKVTACEPLFEMQSLRHFLPRARFGRKQEDNRYKVLTPAKVCFSINHEFSVATRQYQKSAQQRKLDFYVNG